MSEPRLPLPGHLRVHAVVTLSADWGVLQKTTFELRRRDGTWQTQSRETYDRGNGATILLYHRGRGTVVLTRQFRLPVYVNDSADGMLIEAPAGLLDREDAENCIRREAQEETGFRVGTVRRLFEVYMSPGSVTERLAFFAAEYEPQPAGSGGGNPAEGEDIEVLEIPFQRAWDMVARGEIQDGKTLLLLQHARLTGLLDGTPQPG